MNLLTVIQSFTHSMCLVDVASSAGRNIHILQLYYINNRPPVKLRPVGLQTTRHVLIQLQPCFIYLTAIILYKQSPSTLSRGLWVHRPRGTFQYNRNNFLYIYIYI